MFSNFRKWLHRTLLPRPPDNLRTLAFRSGLDRRKFPRVLVPNFFKSEHLPYFLFQEKTYEIRDLSLGGVCLLDTQDQIQMKIGETLPIECVFRGRRETLLMQLAGVSFQKKHFEFKQISPALRESFSTLVEYGLVGQKMQRSALSMTGQIETPIIELWIGVDGSTFCFHSDPNHVAVADLNLLSGEATVVDFYHGSLPLYAPRQNHNLKGQILSAEKRAHLLTLISNFPFLSPRISNLVEDWSQVEKGVMRETG